MKNFFLPALLFLWIYDSDAQTNSRMDEQLQQLAMMMSGEFSSEKQAKEDSAYFHIMLRMKPIWPEKQNGYWFYVEQSMASKQEKPYRQRVYNLYRQDDTTIISKVYEIRNPLKYAGGWKDERLLGNLSSDSLIDRPGCGIFLHRRSNGTYSGSTPGKQCISSLYGASYATSEVVIYPDKLISWDRGWDKNDKQVWGAEKGGYIFIKEKDVNRTLSSP